MCCNAESVNRLIPPELALSYEIWFLVYLARLKISIIAGMAFTATVDTGQLVSWERKDSSAKGKDQPALRRKTGCFSYFLPLFSFFLCFVFFKSKITRKHLPGKNHSLSCPWKKTHGLIDCSGDVCSLVGHLNAHLVQSEPPFCLGFLPAGCAACRAVPAVPPFHQPAFQLHSIQVARGPFRVTLLAEQSRFFLRHCTCAVPRLFSSDHSSSSIPPE